MEAGYTGTGRMSHSSENQARRARRGYGHADDATPFDRFVSKLSFQECGCWLWTGTNVSGYGQLRIVDERGRRSVRAHRFSYESLVGPIPNGLQIDHLCRTKLCVNPAHLEPVTAQVNTLRGLSIQAANAVKTVCLNGHPFDLVINGNRQCSVCRRARSAAWSRAKRTGHHTAVAS